MASEGYDVKRDGYHLVSPEKEQQNWPHVFSSLLLAAIA
jgi:hypothetical protein